MKATGNAVVGQDLCAGQRHNAGWWEGCRDAWRSAAGALPARVGAAQGNRGGCRSVLGVSVCAVLMGTAQGMVLRDAGPGHRMGPGCPALHRTAGWAAAGDSWAAALRRPRRYSALHRTRGGGVRGRGTGAAPRRVFAWDEIPGATHNRERLLGWRCRLVRMAREKDAR